MSAVLLAGFWAIITPGKSNAADSTPPAKVDNALLNTYCIGCHSNVAKVAGISLQNLDLSDIDHNGAVLEKVLRKLRAGEMPPPGMPAPDKTKVIAFTASLQQALDYNALVHPNPGAPTLHRLNRSEYSNAIRDLLALGIDAGVSLPADNSGYGFDNIGDVLSVSPALMERYMAAARKISRLAVGDTSVPPAKDRIRGPEGMPRLAWGGEGLPLGSYGGFMVSYQFPADAEYTFKVQLSKNTVFGGLTKDWGPLPKVDIRIDGARAKIFQLGPGLLNVGGLIDAKPGAAPEDSAATDAVLITNPDGSRQSDDDGVFLVRLPVKAGPHDVSVNLFRDTPKREGIIPPEPTTFTAKAQTLPTKIDYFEIEGPFNVRGPGETPSRAKIFVCRPASSRDEEPCARRIVSNLAHRAYRRPVDNNDLKPLLEVYKTGRAGGSFDQGIELALQRILVSPEFLFRAERDPAGAKQPVHKITDLELASRLSFFLWSSIPDEELLNVAERGELSKTATLKAQVARMLADPKSNALVKNFGGQWLYLRNLSVVKPDPDAYPGFDEEIRRDFRKETEMFLGTVITENRSILDLLDADFTFVNERLAKYYGIPGVLGPAFRRVTLTDDNRRGLLGQGSILTVTSRPNRTSVVVRGKWILDNLLGTPPPPPPPNVPSLKEDGEAAKATTLRQKMEQHRADPNCAVCHSRMDPLGFALENFDGVGQWRTKDGNLALDTTGSLPDGTALAGAAGLRKFLLSRPQQFAGTVTEKLMTYGLGRGLEYYDLPAVRSITAAASKDNYKFQAIVEGIVESPAFQMRRSEEIASNEKRKD